MARRKQDAARAVREFVFRRAQGRCEYCRSPAAFAHQGFSLEHIRPRSRQGGESPENLALSCQGCNNHKYNRSRARDPVSQVVVRLFHPRRDGWSDHFAWTSDGTQILGLTPIGRATVEALQLNRAALVNLRRVLVEAGEHPPPV
jgi:5-methylcytosine-specific restriction endonuclease McrA